MERQPSVTRMTDPGELLRTGPGEWWILVKVKQGTSSQRAFARLCDRLQGGVRGLMEGIRADARLETKGVSHG